MKDKIYQELIDRTRKMIKSSNTVYNQGRNKALREVIKLLKEYEKKI